MGWVSDLRLAIAAERAAHESKQRRPLTDQDRSDWFDAANYQSDRKVPTGRDRVIANIRAGNPVRYRQVQGDIKWIKRRMVKLGLNPEDWRDYV